MISIEYDLTNITKSSDIKASNKSIDILNKWSKFIVDVDYTKHDIPISIRPVSTGSIIVKFSIKLNAPSIFPNMEKALDFIDKFINDFYSFGAMRKKLIV